MNRTFHDGSARESDCPIESCAWTYTLPQITLEELCNLSEDEKVALERHCSQAVIEHLIGHGREGAQVLIRLAKEAGTFDDPDLFLQAHNHGEQLLSGMNLSLSMEELDRWAQSGIPD